MLVALLLLLLPPAAECHHESFAEVAHKPVNGKVEGGVDYLQQLDTGHRVQIPYRSDALQYLSNEQCVNCSLARITLSFA